MEVFGSYILPSTENYSSEKSFNTANQIIDGSSDLDEKYLWFVEKLMTQASEFLEKDSGWALQKIMYLEINVNKFNPIGGSSFVELPAPIRRKEAVVNVRNMDQYCFPWAITSALCPPNSKIAELSSYPHFSTLLNIAGLDFPVNLRDIKTFEQLNNISVNVYGLESKIDNNKIVCEVVGPLRYTERKLVVHVNLLLLK
ncbi:uncharacterized protein LOC115879548 [Sitophilus oryzae]|uniref:Uncharacterized protein LOC115879548 n=1 Tax=Sitophilus oryzae TaxID=7048 RepID=A0A6J2XLV4_SITOR|nr:uncharacterized protein LOC115879548 [Sitophilus oryzae]